MHIGILQTGHAPDAIRDVHGDFDAMFQRLFAAHPLDWRVFDVEGGEVPDDPHLCDGWLITGSKHGAYEDHAWIPPLEALIRAIYAARVPLVGICFGHQIVAQALGGRVEKFAGGWSVGRKIYRWSEETYALNAWHQDQVVELPPGARSLGSSDMCRHAVLAYGDNILTVQPHPEFDAGIVEGLIAHRGATVPPDRLEAARTGLRQPTDSARMADRLAAVLRR